MFKFMTLYSQFKSLKASTWFYIDSGIHTPIHTVKGKNNGPKIKEMLTYI